MERANPCNNLSNWSGLSCVVMVIQTETVGMCVCECMLACVCVYVRVRERERGREWGGKRKSLCVCVNFVSFAGIRGVDMRLQCV